MEQSDGRSAHADFDALLRAQSGSITTVEFCQSRGSHGGVLSTRSVPEARSNTSDVVQQWWNVSAAEADAGLVLEPCPPGGIIQGHMYSRLSPSGRFTAVFRKVSAKSAAKESHVLEVRSTTGVVLARTDLKKAHGDVLSPSWFGGACWSSDERCLYYTAEAQRPEVTHFWEAADTARATTPSSQSEESGADTTSSPYGNVHDFLDDWGEQNTGIENPRVFRVEPWTGAAPTQVPISPSLTARLGWGQPHITPDDNWLIVTAWALYPRRLGSIYCMQRPSGIYAVEVGSWLSTPDSSTSGEASCRAVLLSSGEVQARSARLSPCGRKLVYLGRDGHAAPGDAVAAANPAQPGVLRTHNGAFALRAFAMGAWQSQGCPCVPCADAAPAPLSDGAAHTQAVQYKQGLLPVQECADAAYLSTLLPVVDEPGIAVLEDKPIPCMGGHEASFPGLYTVSLPRKAWSADSSCVALHTSWFSRMVSIVLKVGTDYGGSGSQLQVQGAISSLAVGPQGLTSPQEALKTALRQVGALAMPPPGTPGGLSPTAVRRTAHSAYLSVTAHGWAWDSVLLQVHSPVAGSYLATASVDWEAGCLHFTAHTALIHQHVGDLMAAQHASQLCAPLHPKAAAAAAKRTPLQVATALANLSWKVLRVSPLHKPDVGLVEGIVVLPPHDCPRPPRGYPLILMPHGGPHGAYPTVAFHSVCLFALAGYAVVTVNYRGSTGFGERSLAALPGDCGTMDVLDCVDVAAAVTQLSPGEALQWTDPEALAAFHAASGACVDCGSPDREAFLQRCAAPGGGAGQGVVDFGRISVIGGSHGGFLTAHLIGQFPHVFKAAVARNPVIDISQMVGVTDIPDWCWVETLGIAAPNGGYDYSTFQTPAGDTLAAMRACSPIEHVGKVTAAVLLTTGAKDRRVPPSQSVLYYHSLRALGKTCRMQWYPEDCHPLSSASTDADALVHMLLWLQEHAGQQEGTGGAAQP